MYCLQPSVVQIQKTRLGGRDHYPAWSSWAWGSNLGARAKPGPLLRSWQGPGGGGIWDGGGSGPDSAPGHPFFLLPPRLCSLRCARSASATGCRARARCARAGCGCPRCAPWATCCATDSMAPRASSMATAAATAPRGRNCCAWSPRTRRTSRPPPTTSSTSRNRPISARTADAWERRARPGAPATAPRPRWTAASCSAVAGATVRAHSASPSAATAPSTGAATSAAATARTRAYCTSVCETLRGLAPGAFPSSPPGYVPTQSLQPQPPRFIRARSFLPPPPTGGLLKPLAWAGMNPLAILMDLPRTYLPPSPGRPLVALPPAWPGGERRIVPFPVGVSF